MHETQSTNYPRLNGTHHLIKRVPFEFQTIYSSLTLVGERQRIGGQKILSGLL